MKGTSHAITGAAAWVAVSVPLDLTPAARPFEIVLGCFVAGGAALAADWDHAGTTISKSLGFVSLFISKVINFVSGGHRKGTHSILGTLAFALLMWGSTQLVTNGMVIAPAIIAFFLASLFFSITSETFLGRISKFAILGSVATTVAVFVMTASDTQIPLDPREGLNWFLASAVVGYIAHIIGDFITTAGVPLLHPFTNYHFKFPILGNAGSFREKLFVPGVTIAVVVWSAMSLM